MPVTSVIMAESPRFLNQAVNPVFSPTPRPNATLGIAVDNPPRLLYLLERHPKER